MACDWLGGVIALLRGLGVVAVLTGGAGFFYWALTPWAPRTESEHRPLVERYAGVAPPEQRKLTDDRPALVAAVRPSTPPDSSARSSKQASVDTSDPAALENSSWFGQVQENIRKAEYNVTWQDYPIVGKGPAWHVANRANNFRAYFRADGLHVIERDASDPNWVIRLESPTWGRGEALHALSSMDPVVKSDSHAVAYHHSAITTMYRNSGEGLQQSVTIEERYDGPGPLVIAQSYAESFNIKATSTRNEAHFFDQEQNLLARLRALRATDDRGNSLPVSIRLAKNEIRFIVQDGAAQYPVTIRSQLVAPEIADHRILGGQDYLNLGSAISIAGDLNGDGFGDLVLGAPKFDAGQSNEGGVFIFYGSASGVQATSLIQAESQIEANVDSKVLGVSVSGAGDVNGDGYDDLIVCANGLESESVPGSVYLFHGSPDGISSTSLEQADTRIVSAQLDAFALAVVSEAGDVNGDGYSDIIIGSPFYDNGQADEGAAFLFYGSSIGISSTELHLADVVLESNQSGAEFGSSVASARDVNDDGYDDVLIGARTYENAEFEEGAAFIFHGSSTGIQGTDPASAAAQIEADESNAHLGRSVAGIGDVNADGYADILVGAPDLDYNTVIDSGAAFVFYGSVAGIVGTGPSDADQTLFSTESGAEFGFSVSAAGDYNFDGYADAIIGEPDYSVGVSGAGAVHLFLGSSVGLVTNSGARFVQGQSAFGSLGYAVAGVGDVNGDGFSDVVLGAVGVEVQYLNEGAAYLLYGSSLGVEASSTSEADTLLESDQAGAQLGLTLTGLGDVNGDGFDDVAVGAPFFDNGESDEGAVFVFHGSVNGITAMSVNAADAFIESDQANAEFGQGLAACGDANGDGFADLLVGAHLYDNGQIDEGAAFVFHGSSGGIVGTSPPTAASVIESDQAGSNLGWAVAGIGDSNGDGFADIAVGAPFFDDGEQDEGVVLVFNGSSGGVTGSNPSSADTSIHSNQVNELLGQSISSAGDVNGDGYSDLLLGVPRVPFPRNLDVQFVDDRGGAAFVFHGSSTRIAGTALSDAETTLLPEQTKGAFGFSVASLGDVNGDGFSDIVIGAPRFDNGEVDEGAAFVFHGSQIGIVGTTPSTAAAIVESNQLNGFLGESVSGIGDINRDGFHDLVVSVSDFENGEEDEGAIVVFFGSEDGLVGSDPSTAAGLVESNVAFQSFGNPVANAGDVNGDGIPDILVGSSLYANGESAEGAAFLFYGGPELRTVGFPRYSDTSDGSFLTSPGVRIGGSIVRFQHTVGSSNSGSDSRVRLEYQVAPYGSAWSDSPLLQSDWVVSATNEHRFLIDSAVLNDDANGHRLRMRVARLPERAFKPGIIQPQNPPHGPWMYPAWVSDGPSDFRTSGYQPPTNPSGVAVSQGSLSTTDDLVCTVATASTSPADPVKPIEHEYTWTTSDGAKTVIHTTSNLAADTLSSAETTKGEVWTCTVRGWDGAQFSHLSAANTAPAILNTPPGSPMISITSAVGGNHGDRDNMVCQITVPAPDPDVDDLADVLRYRFEWYRDNVLVPSLTQDFSSALSSTVDFNETTPGEVWRCEVTVRDNEDADGPPAVSANVTILEGGATPSFISLGVSPTQVTLGQSLTASGQIFPTPLGTETVTFTSVDPDGVEVGNFPNGASTPNGIYSKTFFPTQATTGRDPWGLTASWDGDDTYSAATSSTVTYRVLKAQPTVTLSLSASAAEVNFTELTATAVLDAPSLPASPPELRQLLDGRTLELFIRKPDLTSAPSVMATTALDADIGQYVATFAPADFTSAGVVFDQAGTWKFQAQFAGDDNFKAASSPNFSDTGAPSLTIKDGAGYAILIVGALDDSTGPDPGLGEGQIEHTKTMDFVYRTLRERGFADEDIWYMREPTNVATPGDIEVDDTTPSQADLQTAIGTWAMDKMNTKPAPLYLVAIDHGLEGKFYVFSGGFGEERIVTPGELDGYFDTLENSLTSDALLQDRVVVYGACHSGSFIPLMSSAGRVIVTSCKTDELSHRGPVDPIDEIRDGELFVTELFRELRDGRNLKESFEVASSRTGDFTATSTNGGGGVSDKPQEPLLDDNGDGKGSTSESLAFEGTGDGVRAFGISLGFGVSNPGDSASLLQVTQTSTLAELDPLPTLTAKITDATTLHEVWIEVKTPDYAGSTEAATGASDGGEDLSLFQQNVDLFQFDSEQNDGVNTDPPAEGEYTFVGLLMDRTNSTSLSDLMSDPGSYQVYYFVKDLDTGEVGSFLITRVFRGSDSNTPPPAVTLLSPADGAETRSSLLFTWSPSVDPDGDPVIYRLELDKDDGGQSGFESVELFKEEIDLPFTDSSDLVGGSIVDLATYFWRVVPVDSFGASPASNEVRTFHVDNDNAELDGYVSGSVTTGGANVAAFTVQIRRASDQFLVESFPQSSSGTYLSPGIEAGVYDVTVAASGFDAQTRDNVTVQPLDIGGVKRVDFVLVNDGALGEAVRDGFRALDTNADGRLNLAESGLTAGEFDALDLNNDNFLTLYELLEATVGPVGVQNPVYVNLTSAVDPEQGTSGAPFDTLEEGAVFVADGGDVMLQGQTSNDFDSSVFIPGKDVSLKRWTGGTVRIGATGARSGVAGASVNGPGASSSESEARQSIWRRLWNALWGIGGDDSGSATDGNSSGDDDASEDTLLDLYYETVMPYQTTVDGKHIVFGDTPISIRLVSDAPIDTTTLWAEVPAELEEHVVVDWLSHSEDLTDVWLRVTPESSWTDFSEDSVLTTVGNSEVRSDTWRFSVYSVESSLALDKKDYTKALPTGAIGEPLMIGPPEVFEEPMAIAIPVESQTRARDLKGYYFSTALDAWIPIEQVAGFASGWKVSRDGGGHSVVTLETHHAGVVVLTAQP